jgi:hypothetical protein
MNYWAAGKRPGKQAKAELKKAEAGFWLRHAAIKE